MDAGMFRHKIEIQRNAGKGKTDDSGNALEKWVHFEFCHAYVNGYARGNGSNGSEHWAAAMLRAEQTVVFQVRYRPCIDSVTPQDFRIIFRDGVYDIQSADNVQFRDQTVKIKAVLNVG